MTERTTGATNNLWSQCAMPGCGALITRDRYFCSVECRAIWTLSHWVLSALR